MIEGVSVEDLALPLQLQFKSTQFSHVNHTSLEFQSKLIIGSKLIFGSGVHNISSTSRLE